MNPRTKNMIIVAGVVVLVALFGGVVWFLTRKTPAANINAVNANKNVNVVVINSVNAQANVNTNASADTGGLVEARRLANLFVERYGSYSTEIQYQNIVDLEKFMTTKMQKESEAFIATQKKSSTKAVFSAATAKVITTTVLNQSDGVVSFRITTVRTSDTGLVNGQTTYNQDIILRLVKQGDTWLVDNAYWQ